MEILAVSLLLLVIIMALDQFQICPCCLPAIFCIARRTQDMCLSLSL
jgi:hypothetical protein